MNINRIYDPLEKFLHPNKALILTGARQVGKTTLMERFLAGNLFRFRQVTGDDITLYGSLGSQNLSVIKSFCEGYELIAIDEAHKIPHIGIGMKLMVDHIPGIRVLATGSSSFELAGQTGEPLTGRKTTLHLWPVSQMELLNQYNRFELKEKLDEFLLYGSYPAVITANTADEKKRILMEITGSYLFKDILEFERIRSPQILLDLLRMLAYQTGGEVSVNELSKSLGIDNKTVKRYLELLEKTYILVKFRGYSGNLRKEITRHAKYYFVDTGIRNAVIASFNPLEIRNDTGALWENFLVVERLKKQAYTPVYANNFFWRSWSGKEVDFLEERDGHLYGYEFKWGRKKEKVPSLWLEAYQNSSYTTINRDNYLDFIT